MRFLISIIFTAALLLVACQQDPQPVKMEFNNETVATLTAEPVNLLSLRPEPNTFSLPAAEDATGRLVFLYANSLFIAAFDAAAPSLIAQNVIPETLSLASSKQAILYATPDGLQRTLFSDLSTLPIKSPIPSSYLWSPSGLWVVLNTDTPHLLNITTADLQPLPHSASAWLADDRLLFADAIFDPTTGGSQPFATPLEHSLTDLSQRRELQRELNPLALELAPLSESNSARTQAFYPYDYLDVVRENPNNDCYQFSIYQYSVRDPLTPQRMLMSSANVVNVTDLDWLIDGSILYTMFFSTNCNKSNVSGVLFRDLSNNGGTQMIGSGIPIDTVHPYALSPDEQYLAWISTLHTQAFLTLTELSSGRFNYLMTMEDADHFTAVYWIPT